MSPSSRIEIGAFEVEVAPEFRTEDLETVVERLIDPASAQSTVHWGRNYLYSVRLDGASNDVVVKQFRNAGLRASLRRRLEGSKAEKSWKVARFLIEAGLPTPRAAYLIESRELSGPSFFVTEHLSDTFESRYFFRALNAGHHQDSYPEIDADRFLAELGGSVRRLHEAKVWHRDVSVGNMLVRLDGEGAPTFFFIDLNRARLDARLSIHRRTRDLCRLRVFEARHQQIFLEEYWRGRERGFWFKKALYRLYNRLFLWRTELKNSVRSWISWSPRRTAHAHIPEAPEGAAVRDRVVWDRLSDQPHQHASRSERFAVRLTDLGEHMRELACVAGAMPRILRRYLQLSGSLYSKPVPWSGVGVAVRPWEQAPDALLASLERLGVRKVFLRLEPWSSDTSAEEELSRQLHAGGYEVAFGVPQTRDLVSDLERWREAVHRVAERFTPYGRHFQIGQAINRSKWGVWTHSEYRALFDAARSVFRQYDVELLGPAVIDFEFYATAAVLNRHWNGFEIDAVSSLLYVDRRGAPERTQLGFDTVKKVVLLKAIADTSRNSGNGSWITEVNWPLWEGPHAPAGKSVAVSEEEQADYLVRYYLLVLATGLVDRVYWWQIVARGYGLVEPLEDGSFRERPAYHALQTLHETLSGSLSCGPLPAPPGAHLYRFEASDGRDLVVGWSSRERVEASLPGKICRASKRDGTSIAVPNGAAVELGSSPQYFWLDTPGTPADPVGN